MSPWVVIALTIVGSVVLAVGRIAYNETTEHNASMMRLADQWRSEGYWVQIQSERLWIWPFTRTIVRISAHDNPHAPPVFYSFGAPERRWQQS